MMQDRNPTLHDIIVVGGSAGGVEALTRLVAGLAPDLSAAVFVVLHVPPTAPVCCHRSWVGPGACPSPTPWTGKPLCPVASTSPRPTGT